MFGLFKKKTAPEGPVTFQFDLDVARTPQELYRMVDFGDAECWKKQVGSVDATGDRAYRMQLDMCPELAFDINVLDEEPGKLFVYDCVIVPKTGRLVKTIEGWQMEGRPDGGSDVTLFVVAEFDDDLTAEEWQAETQMMGMGVHNALMKFKVHAEMGTEAIREIEAQQALA